MIHREMPRCLSFDVGIKNLAFCDTELDERVFVHKDVSSEKSIFLHGWQVLDISSPASSGKSGNSIHEHAPRLLVMLRDIFSPEKLRGYDFILIENQPSLTNPIMKSIQMIVFSFFHLMKILPPQEFRYEVHLISASNKIKVLHYLPQHEKNAIDDIMQNKCPDTKKGYKYNKTLSKQLVTYLLDKNIVDRESYADTHAQHVHKKDDLADCLLQACIYVLQRKIEKHINTRHIQDNKDASSSG